MEQLNKQEVGNALEQKIKHPKCSMCNGENFIIDESFITHNRTSRLGFTNTGNFIPSVAIVCNNCGHINFHEINVLLKPTAQSPATGETL